MYKKEMPYELMGRSIALREFNPDYIPELFTILSLQERVLASKKRPVFAEVSNDFLNNFSSMKMQECLLYGVFDLETQHLHGALKLSPKQDGVGQLQTWLPDNYFIKGRYYELLNIILPLYFLWTGRTCINTLVEAGDAQSIYVHEMAEFSVVSEVVNRGRLYYEMLYLAPSVRTVLQPSGLA